MIKKAPLIFTPYLKTVIWGGDKICKYKGISQDQPNIGESWEISALPGHESVVAEGEYKGETLPELIGRFGEELLGKKSLEKYGKVFPFLVKLIDARDNLSIQVHPDDKLASQRHDSLGKTEMWYIISSEPDAKIYAGLKMKITPEEYVERVKNNTITEAIAEHESHPGDIFFLPAGRVHAIGAGNLLAEIQESSDITYRIYDYDRRDADGNPRELHTELAKDAIDYSVREDYRTPSPADEEFSELVNCDHFITSRIQIDGEKEFDFDDSSFRVIICLDGKIEIKGQDGNVTLMAGHSALLPAAMNKTLITGKGTLLISYV